MCSSHAPQDGADSCGCFEDGAFGHVCEDTDFGPNPESDHERVAIPVESSENRAQRPLATQRGLGRVNSQTA